jgi:hypothetical protein
VKERYSGTDGNSEYNEEEARAKSYWNQLKEVKFNRMMPNSGSHIKIMIAINMRFSTELKKNEDILQTGYLFFYFELR